MITPEDIKRMLLSGVDRETRLHYLDKINQGYTWILNCQGDECMPLTDKYMKKGFDVYIGDTAFVVDKSRNSIVIRDGLKAILVKGRAFGR